jgi:hypothetical protein
MLAKRALFLFVIGRAFCRLANPAASLQRRAEAAGQSLQQYLTTELSRLEDLADHRRGPRADRRTVWRASWTADRHRRSPRWTCSSVIVVDASVLANVVGDDEAAGQLARARFAAASAVSAPDLVDVETVSVLRRRWLAGDLSDERFRGAMTEWVNCASPRCGAMIVE